LATFYETHGEYDDHANIREPLHTTLIAMAKDGTVKLPRGARLWDRLGTPNLPKWVQIVNMSVHEAPRYPTLLPKLAAIESVLTPSQRKVLARINEYLIEHRGLLEPIPYRERSLKIFGDEHFLDNRISDGSLFQGRLPLTTIYAFEAYEPMPYERPPSRVTGRPVIVLENHHSFASFVMVNAEQNAFSAVCFSSGNTLAKRERSLESIGESVGTTEFLYLGDIDPPGMTFPALCNKARIVRGAAPLKPALGFYHWLLEHGVEAPFDTMRSAAISRETANWILSDNIVRQKMQKLFSGKMRIAQESLDLSTLKAIDMASTAAYLSDKIG
jgi:hypothetical protein